jgi:hypothetical protein
VAAKSFETHKANSINIKRIADNFDNIFAEKQELKLIFNTHSI